MENKEEIESNQNAIKEDSEDLKTKVENLLNRVESLEKTVLSLQDQLKLQSHVGDGSSKNATDEEKIMKEEKEKQFTQEDRTIKIENDLNIKSEIVENGDEAKLCNPLSAHEFDIKNVPEKDTSSSSVPKTKDQSISKNKSKNEEDLEIVLDDDNDDINHPLLFKCNKCQKKFKSKSAEKYHKGKVCPDGVFEKIATKPPNEPAKRKADNKSSSNNNSKDKSKIQTLQNGKKDANFDPEESYSVKRTKYTDGTVLYSCPICDSKYRTIDAIHLHMSSLHSNKKNGAMINPSPLQRNWNRSLSIAELKQEPRLILKRDTSALLSVDSLLRERERHPFEIDPIKNESQYDWSEIDKKIFGRAL